MILKKAVSIVTLLLLIMLFSYRKVEAQNVVFTDDFSNGFEKWQSVRTNLEYWTIEQEAAKAHIPRSSRVVELVPKDEYWNTDWKDLIYEFDFTPIAGADKNFSFKYENSSNWYEIHFSHSTVNLVRIKDGKIVLNKFTTYNLNNNQTYHFKLTLHNEIIKFEIDDTVLMDIIDTSFNENYGKIGIKAGTGSVFPTIVLFDNVKVTTIEDGLDVPYFSQRDPAWGGDEYDSASKYTWGNNPTMDRWGCATTSMAMIMNFHGLTQMPDGTPLTPKTLNDWLKSEKDGYISEGLINWSAATRLSKEIADAYPGKMKLEYSWQAKDLDKLASEIEDKKPVILRVPEHFVVATSYATDSGQIKINDPFWSDRVSLASYDGTFENMRTFQPANSDLSYFLMNSSADLQVVVKDATGTEIQLDQFSEGGIVDPVDGSSTQSTAHISQLAKPSSGQYTIELSQPVEGEFKFDLYVYDQDANPTLFTKNGTVGSEPLVINLNFDKTGETSIEEVVPEEPEPQPAYDFVDLHNSIVKFYKTKKIKNVLAALHLEAPVVLGHLAKTKSAKLSMIKVFELNLKTLSSKYITSDAKQELTEIAKVVRQKYQ